MELCASPRCCLDESRVARHLDRVSPALLAASRSPRLRAEVLRDVEACRNALSKVLGGARALRARVKNVSSLREVSDTETIVNTFVNMLNRIVEVRNIVQRIREAAEDRGESEVSRLLGEAMASLSALAIEVSAIALSSIPELRQLTRDDCGKLASAIGTAVFAALLDAGSELVRDALARCFGRI
ncbi:MAG: hypothetical protein GXO32_00030 [Crenarchaeota archaeon]|nr:hypothetical protein [Thermoproteota archaeon]